MTSDMSENLMGLPKSFVANTTPDFKAWPKTPRFFRDITITEKIDGTNAAVGIMAVPQGAWVSSEGALVPGEFLDAEGETDGNCDYLVYAQSRKRIITPDADNFKFAAWVYENAPALVDVLGVGLHYGEWWGKGIQRGYWQAERYFSLFNTSKWNSVDLSDVPNLSVVPELYTGPMAEWAINTALADLKSEGSAAARKASGMYFDEPEGIIVFHHAANACFKVTVENDESPKGANA